MSIGRPPRLVGDATATAIVTRGGLDEAASMGDATATVIVTRGGAMNMKAIVIDERGDCHGDRHTRRLR